MLALTLRAGELGQRCLGRCGKFAACRSGQRVGRERGRNCCGLRSFRKRAKGSDRQTPPGLLSDFAQTLSTPKGIQTGNGNRAWILSSYERFWKFAACEASLAPRKN